MTLRPSARRLHSYLFHPLNDVESLGPDPFLHLQEVGFCGSLVPVAAGVSEVGVALQTLDQILHVGYLEYLSEHEVFQIPFGLIFYGSSGAFGVEAFPEDGWIGV